VGPQRAKGPGCGSAASGGAAGDKQNLLRVEGEAEPLLVPTPPGKVNRAFLHMSLRKDSLEARDMPGAKGIGARR